MRILEKEWDSAFFQIKIGEVYIDNPEKHYRIEESGFDLIVANCKKEFNLNLTGYENSYEGGLLLYEKNIETFSTKYDLTNIKKIGKKESFNREELYEIAYESGKFSRFKADRNFNKFAFKKLYRKWVDKSLNSTIADELLVFEDRGSILGFISYKIQNGSCYIGLLGIKPDEQGKGIGGKLLTTVENKSYSQGVKKIKVKTQKINLPAINFYEAKNFREEEINFIKHYWKR